MTHVPHDLTEEFPEHLERLHELKESSGHFAHLAARYYEVNRTIHRAETDLAPMSDEALHALKAERLHLKDQISEWLRAPA